MEKKASTTYRGVVGLCNQTVVRFGSDLQDRRILAVHGIRAWQGGQDSREGSRGGSRVVHRGFCFLCACARGSSEAEERRAFSPSVMLWRRGDQIRSRHRSRGHVKLAGFSRFEMESSMGSEAIWPDAVCGWRKGHGVVKSLFPRRTVAAPATCGGGGGGNSCGASFQPGQVLFCLVPHFHCQTRHALTHALHAYIHVAVNM